MMNDVKRPVSVLFQRHADDGGITDEEAKVRGLTAADGFVTLRYAADGDAMKLFVTSCAGESGGPVGPAALFEGWLAFTAYVAGQCEESDPKHATFLKHILNLLQLDERLNLLSSEPVAEPAPAAPTLQPDEGPSSTG